MVTEQTESGVTVARRRSEHPMGWRMSLADHRDQTADTSGITILDQVDPRETMPPIYNQLKIGACTAHAVKRVFEEDRQQHGESPAAASRIAIYWLERFLENSPANADTGAEGRDGFKALQKFGVPTEAEWSYTDVLSNPHFFEDPRAELPWSDFVKLTRPYKSVPQTEQAIKAALSNKQMVAVGASLYESFESLQVEKTGIVPMPGPTERIIGGHEFTLIGYLTAFPLYVLCANSWGSKNTDGTVWGLDGEGCFLLPWAYVLSKLTGDFRTIPRVLGA